MPNLNWEQRLQQFKDEEIINIQFEYLCDGLSDEENARLEPLFDLAIEASKKLAYNMLKGVLKYKTEARPAREWVDYGIDDACDTVNYMYLIRAAMDAERPSL